MYGNLYEVPTANELIVGNHDSLILFGNDAQQTLIDVSKKLSSLVLKDNGEIEYLIQDIVLQIDEFQKDIIKKRNFEFIYSEKRKRDKLIKKYNELLVYIDKMELLLKLQEAQLIKDSKFVDEMKVSIQDSLKKMEESIAYGKEVLLMKNEKDCRQDNIDEWYIRLSKKINDLETSHAVAIQNYFQLKLMAENNEKLIDKIISAVTGTIPIWRNQVSLLLGIEKMNRNIRIQDKVSKVTNECISQDNKRLKKSSSQGIEKVDVDKLYGINNKFKCTINAIYQEEKSDSKIRMELNSATMQI